MNTPEAPSAESPTFEAALAALQDITHRLEDGQQGLEASLADFERGVKLLRTCYRLLDSAEQKIEQLVKFNAAGEAELVPFDATATAGQASVKRQPARRRAPAEKPPSQASGQLGFDESAPFDAPSE